MNKRLRRSLNFFGILALTFAVCIGVKAGSGDYDTTFGFFGSIIDSFPNHPCYGVLARASTLEPNGKILVVGKLYNKCSYTENNDPQNIRRVLLRRYLANGLPDNGASTRGGFGMDGFAVAETNVEVEVYGDANSVLVQPDGKIVVAGYKVTPTGTVAAVWRFTSGGELDIGFGSDGVITFSTSANEKAYRLALSEGKILVGGVKVVNAVSTIWLRRLKSNGVADLPFGSWGVVQTGMETEPNYVSGGYQSFGMEVNPADGDIIVTGVTGAGWPLDSPILARYDNTGHAVSGFGTGGKAVYPKCGSNGGPLNFTEALFQADGKIVAYGTAFYVGSAAGWLVRTNSDGSVDNLFALGGTCNAITGSPAKILRVQSDDKILVGNLRFLANGDVDPTWTNPLINELIVSTSIRQNDGKIVFASRYYNSSNQPGIRLTRVIP